MLRTFVGACQQAGCVLLRTAVNPRNVINSPNILGVQRTNFFSTLRSFTPVSSTLTLLQPRSPVGEQNRSVTKYSWGAGKRKSVKAVLKRFYRLDWGGWIRTKAGRNKKLWKKHPARKRRLRQHVFCNAKQNTLLDMMVTSYWRKPKYYVDDPYEPYHTREEFAHTYKIPRPYVKE